MIKIFLACIHRGLTGVSTWSWGKTKQGEKIAHERLVRKSDWSNYKK